MSKRFPITDNPSRPRFQRDPKIRAFALERDMPLESLHKSTIISITEQATRTQVCLSYTQSTTKVQYYLLPNTADVRFVEEWVKEFSPHLPTLGIELVEMPQSLAVPLSKVGDKHKRSPGSAIADMMTPIANDYGYFRIPLSIMSATYYTITSSNVFTHCRVNNMTFLFEAIGNELIKSGMKILKGDIRANIREFIREFARSSNTEKLFKAGFECEVFLDKKDLKNFSEYYVDLFNTGIDPSYKVYINRICDYNEKTKLDLETYLVQVFDLSDKLFNTFIHILKDSIKKLEIKCYAIKVNYGRKSYPSEGYMATHFIRMALFDELHPVVKRYYEIKELVPEVEFWYKLVLAFFGFHIHGYYWFTYERFLKPFTDAEFLKKMKASDVIQSNHHFIVFAAELSDREKQTLTQIYESGDLKRFMDILSGNETFMVKLRPEKKDRFTYLKLRDEYQVQRTEGDYYYVIADDFVIRRYMKSNFITE